MKLDPLKERLGSWTDIDVAGYELAVTLGLMDPEVHTFHLRAKHVSWSAHPIGDLLVHILDLLAEARVLEKRNEPDYQYRWNEKFKGTWE